MNDAVQQISSFSLRLLEFLDDIEYRRADADEDREPIYRLRYDAYKRDNNITSGFSADGGDFYDKSANCHVFGVYLAGSLVSSIRVNICSAENGISPTMTIFPEILEPMIEEGLVFVDPSRFVVDRDISQQFPELIYATLRLVPMAAFYFNADYCLATVRPEHNAFYRKIFLLRSMSDPRLFPTLSMPVNMMGGRLVDVKKKVIAKYPVFDAHFIEQRMLFNASHWPTLPARLTSSSSTMPTPQEISSFSPNFAGLQ